MSQIQMFSGKINSPVTTLSIGIDSSVTTISVTDASKLSLAPNLCTISGGENAETIKYTGISGNDLTGCTRGFQGIAQPWNMGVSVMRAFTAYDHDTFKNNIEDHADQINEHLSETMSYEGNKFTINNPYSFGGSLSLKGQLHCHTANSDGANTPIELVTAYKNAGFDFITITDHDVITADPSVSGITWIGTSCEETIYRHIVAYDIDVQSTSLNVQDVMTFHRNNNKMTSIAHPTWANQYIVGSNEIKSYFDFNFIEVYNALVTGNGEAQWDIALSFGKKVFVTAVDDCHNIITDLGKAWVVVKTNANTKSDILDSIRKGNFYASTGNDISISQTGNVITALSISSSNIYFIGRDGRVLQSTVGVTSASYTIKGDEVYVRVKSTKVSDSTIAWSQPIFIDIIGDNAKVLTDINNTKSVSGVTKQAIVNGNFDIWQSGSVWTNPISSSSYHNCLADRWGIEYPTFIGTPPTTITHSTEACYGTVPESMLNYRITTNGAGSGYGVNDFYLLSQLIEHGTRNLCGNNKKVTISFWARSSIANKKLGVYIAQRYGTGGTPTAQENIIGNYFTLTSDFREYTLTIDTNTIATKSFGTDFNDELKLLFVYMYGSTFASRVNDTVTETFGGSGYTDIAHIQVGNVLSPFYPNSYLNELIQCQRYKYQAEIGSYFLSVGYTDSILYFWIPLPVPLKKVATILFGVEGTDWQLSTPAMVGQTGFVLAIVSGNAKGILISATKTSHGLTSASLKIITSNNYIVANF